MEYLEEKEVQFQSAEFLIKYKLNAANFKYTWQVFTPAQLKIAGAGDKSEDVERLVQGDAVPACSDSAATGANVWRSSGLVVKAIRVFLNTETIPTNYSTE